MATSKKDVIQHPGQYLKATFILPLEMKQSDFAKHTGISEATLSRLINGRIAMNGKLAFIIGKATKTDARFWLNLQHDFELNSAKKDKALAAEVKKVKVLPGL